MADTFPNILAYIKAAWNRRQKQFTPGVVINLIIFLLSISVPSKNRLAKAVCMLRMYWIYVNSTSCSHKNR